MYNAGLVLEGGGMKGIYTSGVLEFFLEKDIFFKDCYGVSAGACTLASYISKQKGRGYRVTVDYLEDKNYCSLYSLITTGDLFNVKTCYQEIPERLDPYDFKAAINYEGNAYAVVTNIVTGKAEYMPMREMHKDIIVVRASASMPLVSRNVKIGDNYYLDGALADSIPLKHSIEEGNTKNVVIMTKEVGYVRKPISKANKAMLKLKYGKKYPKVYELMSKRHIQYNNTLKLIEQEVKEGRAFLFQPKEPNEIGRVEKDRAKLEALYKIGYEDAKANYDKLMEFLNK